MLAIMTTLRRCSQILQFSATMCANIVVQSLVSFHLHRHHRHEKQRHHQHVQEHDDQRGTATGTSAMTIIVCRPSTCACFCFCLQSMSTNVSTHVLHVSYKRVCERVYKRVYTHDCRNRHYHDHRHHRRRHRHHACLPLAVSYVVAINHKTGRKAQEFCAESFVFVAWVL